MTTIVVIMKVMMRSITMMMMMIGVEKCVEPEPLERVGI